MHVLDECINSWINRTIIVIIVINKYHLLFINNTYHAKEFFIYKIDFS